MNDADYHRLLAEMAYLVEHEPDRTSAEGRRLDELAALADEYEAPDVAGFYSDVERR